MPLVRHLKRCMTDSPEVDAPIDRHHHHHHHLDPTVAHGPQSPHHHRRHPPVTSSASSSSLSLSSSSSTSSSPSKSTRRRRGLRRRLGGWRAHPIGDPASLSDGADCDTDSEPIPTSRRPTPSSSPPSAPIKSVSTTELLSEATASPAVSPCEGPRRRCSDRRQSSGSIDSALSDKTTHSMARKGVTYGADGRIVCCRFCEILRTGDAEFIFEDATIAVFRPLYPVVDSHVLVVPRCHIRNINMLTQDHVDLLQRMKEVAEFVLHREGARAIECKFAFHKPPFNSIDHVHMHAFRKNEGSFGCLGSIKYRTETWWCRSFDQVVAQIDGTSPQHKATSPTASVSGFDPSTPVVLGSGILSS